jgi:hypothetical protein
MYEGQGPPQVIGGIQEAVTLDGEPNAKAEIAARIATMASASFFMLLR